MHVYCRALPAIRHSILTVFKPQTWTICLWVTLWADNSYGIDVPQFALYWPGERPQLASQPDWISMNGGSDELF